MTVYHKGCGSGPVMMEVESVADYIVDGVDEGGPFYKAGAAPEAMDIQEVSYYCKACKEFIMEDEIWDSNDLCNCGFKDDDHGNGFECPRNLPDDDVSEER